MIVRTMISAIAIILSGCSTEIQEIGREPKLAPIGAGVWTETVEIAMPAPEPESNFSKGSVWRDQGAHLFRDARAVKAGDIVTVSIEIDDEASLDTKSNRSRKSSRDVGLKYDYDYAFPSASATGQLDGGIEVDGATSTDGKGKTSRSEKVRFNVAAIVTDVMPNGNLLISGSQEVRVNYELRVVSVAGVVRPRDISRENTISYDKIAEARISYGGRGRAMEVQQPAWGQQVIDVISPM